MIAKKLIIGGIFLFLFTACASTNTSTRVSDEESATYTSTFPAQEISKKLQIIQESVFRISSTAIYTTYFFEDEPITKQELSDINFTQRASRQISENKSSAGTALGISGNNNWGLLITNHHVINYPDTVISYREKSDGEPSIQIEAVAIKTDQRNHIYDASQILPFSVVGVNSRDDLALLEVNLNQSPNITFKPLQTKIGDSKDLKLASVLYILGFPKGLPMVTRSVVSDPNRNSQGNFLTDALFNEGISGGIILASKDNFESFEWVGMASSSYANAEYILVPNPMISKNFDPLEVYDGQVFVKRKTHLNYGITEAIPMQTIISFLLVNKTKFFRRDLRLKKYQKR